MSSFVLEGCAGPHLIKGPTSENSAYPDSLKAKFTLSVEDPLRGGQMLSGVLFAVPYKRYRMELSGPMGIGVGSVLWSDSGWTFVLPQQKKYIRGKGYLLGGFAGIPFFDIHQVASAFWGELLPRDRSIQSSSDSAGLKVLKGKDAQGIAFEALKDKNGRVVCVSRGGMGSYEFDVFADFDGLVVPMEIKAYSGSRKVLSLHIKSIKKNVPWSAGTWRLPVPDSYEPLEE